GRKAVPGFRTNRKLGPQLGEKLFELAAQQRLVFSDDRRQRVHLPADTSTFTLRAPVLALGTARRADNETFTLRAPVFALGTARRADNEAFTLRAPVFALGTARRAHAVFP